MLSHLLSQRSAWLLAAPWPWPPAKARPPKPPTELKHNPDGSIVTINP